MYCTRCFLVPCLSDTLVFFLFPFPLEIFCLLSFSPPFPSAKALLQVLMATPVGRHFRLVHQLNTTCTTLKCPNRREKFLPQMYLSVSPSTDLSNKLVYRDWVIDCPNCHMKVLSRFVSALYSLLSLSLCF